MSSVFELLDEIRKRPGMFVGGDESQRIMQLRNLELLLGGYTIALTRHGIREPVTDFVCEFGEYLWKTRGWSASCGPVAAVREAVKTDNDAWELFWKLTDEFRASVETRR